MKVMSFTLSMPNVGSWNGKWTGSSNLYVITSAVTDAEHKIISDHNGYFYYSWGDGWGAGVTCREVSREEAAKLRKKSKGFYGYDWMVSSILKYGKIMATHDIKKWKERQAEYVKEWSESMMQKQYEMMAM